MSRTESMGWARRARNWFLWSLLVGVTALGTHEFCWYPTYTFPPAQPFFGDRWYNPYATSGELRLRACFHAHSRTLGGITNASSSLEELHAVYRGFHTDLIGVSDYQRIRPALPEDDGLVYLPVYEHGYGFGGQHQTVIGAERVRWTDYMFGQNTHQMQSVIDTLRSDGSLVILNHPNKAQGYSLDALTQLTGALGIEIQSRYAKGTVHWDHALSLGRPLWGFCSDDSHDLARSWHIGSGWVEIDVDTRTPEAVLEALRIGRFTSIWAKSRGAANRLRSLRVEGDQVVVSFVRPVEWIHVIGQGGEIRSMSRGVDTLSVPLRDDDTYIRFRAMNDNTYLNTNPVFRYSGDDPLAPPPATIAAGPTAIRRTLGVLWGLGVLALGFALGREHRLRARKRSAIGADRSKHDVTIESADDVDFPVLQDSV